MIKKEIIYCGQKAILACDGKCEKAWGINNRPKIQLSKDDDDYCFLADDELGTAPIDPGTYEDDQAKPTNKNNRLNKWCCRECERCYTSNPDECNKSVVLTNFSERVYNIPRTNS